MLARPSHLRPIARPAAALPRFPRRTATAAAFSTSPLLHNDRRPPRPDAQPQPQPPTRAARPTTTSPSASALTGKDRLAARARAAAAQNAAAAVERERAAAVEAAAAAAAAVANLKQALQARAQKTITGSAGPDPGQPGPAASSLLSRLGRLVAVLVPLGLTVHLLAEFGATVVATQGPSMVPVLDVSGNAVLISRWHRRGRGIGVGDVVAFKHPLASDQGMIKRVVGMPGDFVVQGSWQSDSPATDSDGQTLADASNWKGLGLQMDETEPMIEIPPGHCYVVGDNLPWSRDSRMFGPIPLALITGKVEARVWPPWKAGWITNNVTEIKRVE